MKEKESKLILIEEFMQLLNIQRKETLIRMMTDIRMPKKQRIPMNCNIAERVKNPKMSYMWIRKDVVKWINNVYNKNK